MNDHSRREFLQALGLTPVLGLLLASKKHAAPTPVATATPPADPEDALKDLRAFRLPDGTEPAGIFVPLRGNR